MHHQSPTCADARSSLALAEFHVAAGHAGTADSCQDCQTVQREQRQAAAALRAHQRRIRQRIDGILGRSS